MTGDTALIIAHIWLGVSWLAGNDLLAIIAAVVAIVFSFVSWRIERHSNARP